MEGSKKNYKIKVDRKFLKDIERLEEEVRERIVDLVDIIIEDPLIIFSMDVKKLKGYKNTFRLRMGKYRLLFSVDKKEKVITLLRFLKRERAYK